jgi:membrane associated rhomboid family serine protease
MVSKNNALIVAGVIFAIVTVMHLFRVAAKFQVVVAGCEIPIWANIGGFVIAGLLAVWMFAAAKQK